MSRRSSRPIRQPALAGSTFSAAPCWPRGALDSQCVSIWSGILRDQAGDEEAFERLTTGLGELLRFATEQGVRVSFEPEPGMFIDTQCRWAELLARSDHPQLALTLDIGHLHCQGEWPLADQIRRWGSRLANVHIEDMRAGVHEHLMFGEGEIDFPAVMRALAETGYAGGVHVELSRHGHDAPQTARKAYDFLSPLMPSR